MGISYPPDDVLDSETRHEYGAILASFSNESRKSRGSCRTSLLDYIEIVRQSGDTSDELSWLLEYKLELLQDNDSLEVRLKVLDYLVKEMEQPPPSMLDAFGGDNVAFFDG